MPAAVPAPPVFDLKSTAWTLTTLRLQVADVPTLAAALEARFADSPGLFDGEGVAIDLAALRESDVVVDFPALLPQLRHHGMLPVAAMGGSTAQMAAARAAGLAEAPDAPAARAEPPRPVLKQVVRAAPVEVVREVEVIREVEVVREVVRDAPAEAPAAVPPMVIDKPLRSGQRIYARGGDLIVLAVVSFGAEVIADGNIHVYAPLRGRAIAGARGDVTARIYGTCLEPQLVSIAGIYRTTETPLPDDVLGKPALVRLDGEKIIVEPLNS
ncbi:MAG: septum site-determining protein MinC [Pseudomonadota bacterium]